ncbi:hypothetical protein GGI23_000157 [Coemansia sp. RSA 2559]|nr:hypothetical protein GGI23_000157 [Coemansia sp. RSA 2559]KAJ2869620.1 hypothetical protein GGI22_000138 [Coemansia erecta]
MNATVVSHQPCSPVPCHPDSAPSADSSMAATQQLSLALTRNQYSLECGGVLLDPATNEVCLLFYPDTSEWRLPMGKPDAMDHHQESAGAPPAGADPSVAGCEPPAHAAQRQISLITGYRCTHLHPAVTAHTKESSSACAYIGPHMVEPLALQIEQRLVAAQPSSSDSTSNSPSMDLGAVAASATVSAVAAPAATDDDYQMPRSSSTRLVMTYYYTAWLTQGRFEAKAATLPVGPAAASNGSDGVLTLGANTTTGKAGLPLAEVTWFKMDTAAQVLTHESDKLALREAIHRLTRLPVPVAASQARYSAVALASQHQHQHQQNEFASGDLFGAKISDTDLQQPALLTAASVDVVVAAGAQAANASSAKPSTSSASSSLSSSSSTSDGATKADDSNATTKMTTGRPSNMDILRKTATSISKRGGSLFAKSKAAAIPADSSVDNTKQMVVVSVKEKTSMRQSSTQNTNKQQITTAAVTAATAGKQAIVPRVMSIFYKLVGPATSNINNST